VLNVCLEKPKRTEEEGKEWKNSHMYWGEGEKERKGGGVLEKRGWRRG